MRNQTFPTLLAALFAWTHLAATEARSARLPEGVATAVPASDAAHASRAAQCSYAYDGLAFERADKKQSYWKVGVKVSNNSAHPVNLEGMRYSLLHQQDTLMSDWKTSDRVVKPGESATFQTVLSLPNKVLKNLPKHVLKDPKARFTLLGDAYQEERTGLVRLPKVVQQTIQVDMPKQMAKARKMFFRSLFSA